MWIIQSKHPDIERASIYFVRTNNDNEAVFTDYIVNAKKYETATLAKAAIKDNDLTNANPIPY